MNGSRILTGIAAALLTYGAGAAEFEYGVEVGIGTSDNIARVPANEQSETIATAGLDLSLAREGGRVEADVEVDLSYYDYQDNTFDSEVSGMANADIRVNFVPQRFIWVLTENFGQTELDPFAASTPANRENINYFTTGPDLTVRLGSVGSLTLFGRYSMTTFEESNFDDERTLGGISLGRDLSARSNVSLNATAERVEFDNPAFGSDYDRQSAFLRCEVDGARTRIGAEVGYTEIHDSGDTNSSPLLELDFARDLSERSTVTLLAGIRSSDAASALRAAPGAEGGIPSQPGQISSTDTFETSHARLGWQFNAQRTNIMLSAGTERDEYDNQNQLDLKRNSFQASAQRQITPRLRLRVQGTLSSTEFESTGQDDDETQFGLHLSWNVTGRLYVEVDVDKFDRKSTNALSEFDETRAFLRFAWRSAGGPSGAR